MNGPPKINNMHRSPAIAETPQTPRTPRSPRYRSGRLHSPTGPSLPSTTDILQGYQGSLSDYYQYRANTPKATRTRTLPAIDNDDNDNDINDDNAMDLTMSPRKRPFRADDSAYPSDNPTPSEILSMDLNVMALHSKFNPPATPSSKLSDFGIRQQSLGLPFESLTGSPSRRSARPSASMTLLESVHRYPTRNHHPDNSSVQNILGPMPTSRVLTDRSPARARDTAARGASEMSKSSAVESQGSLSSLASLTPPRALRQSPSSATPSATKLQTLTSPQPILDMENNLFLTRSPAAHRTKQVTASRPNPLVLQDVYTTPRTTGSAALDNGQDVEYYDPTDDERVETESLPSTVSGDLEKENHTPKMDDTYNPFFSGPESSRAGSSSAASRKSSAAHLDGSCTPQPQPQQSASGVITRSQRLALGSISPWRWNNLAELTGASLHLNNPKVLKATGGFTEGTNSPKHKPSGSRASVSAWMEGTIPTTPTTTESPLGANMISRANLPTGWIASNAGPSMQGGQSSKGTQGNDVDQENPLVSTDKKNEALALAAKLTESVIQPNLLVFNRRAQQVAGRIYYWDHGAYHLVSEQDRQQWPGLWKFDIYQDPESPKHPGSMEESGPSSTSFSSRNGIQTNFNELALSQQSSHQQQQQQQYPTSHIGKGKLTDRQLTGPAHKKMKMQQQQHGTPGRAGDKVNRADQDHHRSLPPYISALEESALARPQSPESSSSGHSFDEDEQILQQQLQQQRQQQQQQQQFQPRRTRQSKKLQPRYELRERRMLNKVLRVRSQQ